MKDLDTPWNEVINILRIGQYESASKTAHKILAWHEASIKQSLPKEQVNTKDESNSDYFYGYGWNSALAEVKKRLGVDDE